MLKRLSDARRDGDEIYAVIAGSAVNHDGRSNGMLAPNPDGARALIEYLTRPEVQAVTLQQVAFFPVVEGELPTDLGEGDPGLRDRLDLPPPRSVSQALGTLRR